MATEQKTLTMYLNKGLIIEAVKADTYITGAIDKSADGVKNAALAYNEQAGDDTYHERKLQRTLAGAVGSFEANLAEFVDTAAEEDGITDTLASAGDTGAFTITIKVSDRYNSGLGHPITQLAQEYIINKMLYYWWQSIRPALAKDYLAFTTESLTNIRLCLAKTAPKPSSADYSDVYGEVTGGSSAAVLQATVAYNDGWEETVAHLRDWYQGSDEFYFGSASNGAYKVKNGTTELFTIDSGAKFTPSMISTLPDSGSVSFVPVGTPNEADVLSFSTKGYEA